MFKSSVFWLHKYQISLEYITILWNRWTKLKTIWPFKISIIKDRNIQKMYMYVLTLSFANIILLAAKLPLTWNILIKHVIEIIKHTIWIILIMIMAVLSSMNLINGLATIWHTYMIKSNKTMAICNIFNFLLSQYSVFWLDTNHRDNRLLLLLFATLSMVSFKTNDMDLKRWTSLIELHQLELTKIKELLST